MTTEGFVGGKEKEKELLLPEKFCREVQASDVRNSLANS
jgi:hypothetical protein